MIVNFGRIFFPAVPLGCFLRMLRMLVARLLLYFIIYKEILSKAVRFSSRDEVFIWKILSRLCRDPALNKWDPTWPGQDGKRLGFFV